ncbi:uncharacterized protein DNG_06331 [Cephalotrichum gorgonifer]|uniref:Ankyrin n=1 Tax=Cephalotrichum gorgonifer TaxID=2041049 RepID=A0AAE8N1D5_9PEZI|nr:uncharacterized protein DNG_06331 [Cephalotrichum gorgonifer]
MVKLLIDNGAKINKPQEGSFGSALAAAAGALRSNPKVVHYLLDRGDENTINQPLRGLYGTALIAAIWARKGGAEDFQEEREEVHNILGHSPPRFAEFAAEMHARIEYRGLEDLKRGDIKIVEILLDRGARVNNPAAEEGGLMGACEAAAEGGNAAIIEMVFQRLAIEWEELAIDQPDSSES